MLVLLAAVDGGTAALIGAGIGAVAATTGVLIGKVFDRQEATRHWRREQRSMAYANFIAAAEALFGEMIEEPRRFDIESYRACYRELTRADAVVSMFGEEPAVRAAQRVWNYVTRLADDEVAASEGDDWLRIEADLRPLITAFVNAARSELGYAAIEGRTADLDDSPKKS